MSNLDSSNQVGEVGSFWTGLSIGIFAGAAGYFLLATKDGQQATRRLQDTWRQIEDRVLATTETKQVDSVQKNKNSVSASIKTTLLNSLQDLLNNVAQPDVSTEKKKTMTKQAKSKTAVKRFKGV